MNKFFKQDVLDFKVIVNGETDDYEVRMSFGGLLDNLKDRIAKNNGILNSGVVVKALIDCFNHNDVYTACTCPDYVYRIGYWASVNDLIVGDKETRPSDETNPDDKLGPACKHICLVLNNNSWIYKLASTINNYCHYMESHYKKAYAGIIYPALYGTEYEEPGKVGKEQEIGSDTGILDIANKYGATRGRFQKKNPQDVKFDKASGEPIVDEEEIEEN
jgi:hypothetical protein